MRRIIENRWLTIAYGFLLVVVGVLTLVYAIINPDVVTSVLSISIAVSLFIIGAANIALAFIAHTNDFFSTSLLIGSGAIAFGVLLCIDRELIGQFIVYLLGVFFIAFAVVALIKFILFIVYRQRLGWIIIYGIVTAVAAAAGILILCFRGETVQVLYGIIGSFIILAGLFEIIVNVRSLIRHSRGEDDLAPTQPTAEQDVETEGVATEEE